jgi:hypothetical protein
MFSKYKKPISVPMLDRTRRIIAYIAGRLISGKVAESVVDVGTGLSCLLQGDVEPTRIELHDVEENCSIKGSGSLRELIFTDQFSKAQVKMIVQDKIFYGWDLTSNVPFYGRVNGDEIRIKHPGETHARQFLI